MAINILWFRRDIRLEDNEVVTQAAADNQAVLPCFIIDSWFYTWSDVGKARVRFLFESLEDLDHNFRQRGSKLYLFEGNAVTVLQNLTQQLQQQSGDAEGGMLFDHAPQTLRDHRPKLFFNHDVQVQYGIDRDTEGGMLFDHAPQTLRDHHSIIDFYQQHNLDYHLGLNNFLQTDSERQGVWFDEYYTYLRQPLHLVPERINTPKLKLNLPQLTFAQLKQKYSRFWGADNNYFIGGESQAKATLKSFLAERFHGYHWKVSRP